MTPLRYVGDTAVGFTLDVLPGLDLTGGTGLIKFRRPDGTVLSVAATVSAVNRTLSYTFVAGNLDQPGIWAAWGQVTIGSMIAHAHPVSFRVGAAP